MRVNNVLKEWILNGKRSWGRSNKKLKAKLVKSKNKKKGISTLRELNEFLDIFLIKYVSISRCVRMNVVTIAILCSH